MAYRDRDHSKGLSNGDSEHLPLCYDDEPVLLAWFPEATDLNTAWGYVNSEYAPGWHAAKMSAFEAETFEPLTEDQRSHLTLDWGCEWP
jgi:hypothetical protein